jgi:uncharacterized membrane protein YuzA (DUF378 family)
MEKILNRIAKLVLLAGGITWGIIGATSLLGMPSVNIVTTLLGFANLQAYANWVYVLVGASAAYLSFICFKKKDY